MKDYMTKVEEMKREILAMAISNIIGLIVFVALWAIEAKYIGMMQEFGIMAAIVLVLYVVYSNYKNLSKTFNEFCAIHE